MFCRPARSSSATNGVVFQTSARMTGTQAAAGWMNHTTGSCSTPTLDQHAVHDSGLPLEHEAPEQGRDHGRNGPGNQHRGPHQAPAAEGAVQGQRQPESDDQLEPHAGDREERGVPQRAPEPRDRRAPRHSCRVPRTAGPATASGGRAGGAIPTRVQTSGKSATSRMVSSAGRTSAQAIRASCRSMPGPRISAGQPALPCPARRGSAAAASRPEPGPAPRPARSAG